MMSLILFWARATIFIRQLKPTRLIASINQKVTIMNFPSSPSIPNTYHHVSNVKGYCLIQHGSSRAPGSQPTIVNFIIIVPEDHIPAHQSAVLRQLHYSVKSTQESWIVGRSE